MAACRPPQAEPLPHKGQSKEELFRFGNSALVFIDHQSEMLASVRSIDTKLMTLNAKALASFAVKAGFRSS